MKQGEVLGGQHFQLKSNLKQLIIQYSLVLIDHSATYLEYRRSRNFRVKYFV